MVHLQLLNEMLQFSPRIDLAMSVGDQVFVYREDQTSYFPNASLFILSGVEFRELCHASREFPGFFDVVDRSALFDSIVDLVFDRDRTTRIDIEAKLFFFVRLQNIQTLVVLRR